MNSFHGVLAKSGENVDDNQGQLNVGLRWPSQAMELSSHKATFIWDDSETSRMMIARIVEPMMAELNLDQAKLAERSLNLDEVELVTVLEALTDKAPEILRRIPDSVEAKTLQLMLIAWLLAKRVVDARDVMSAAFIDSFSVDKRLNVLRETADATDDVMPSWGSGNGKFVGCWIPAWSIQELQSARMALIGQVFAADDIWPDFSPEMRVHTMDWFVIRAVERIIRSQSIDVRDSTDDGATTYRVMYRGEADVFEAWRDSLKGQSAKAFAADGWLVARSMRQVLQKSGWRSDIVDDLSGKSNYILSFHLVPPTSDGPSADWRLVYYIRHVHFGWSEPLAHWWQMPSRMWKIGGDTLIHPDTWVLPKLREASQASTFIEQSLTFPRPSDCVIPADDVYAFLMEAVPKLRSLGFGIETPDVLHGDHSKIRVRVRVKRQRTEHKRSRGSGTQWFDANGLVDFDWSVVIDDEELSHEAFTQMVTNQTPFVQVGGSWRLVPVDEILRQLDQIGGAKSTRAGVLDLSRAILMSDEDSNLPMQIEYDDDALPIEHVMKTLLQATDPPHLPTPSSFHGELRHYQEFGYGWMMHLRSIGCGACLADDMGLGKTVQVLAYLLKLQETGAEEGIHLLVCPTSLLPNWRAELTRFAPSLKVYVHHGPTRDLARHAGEGLNINLVMTTYATLVRDAEAFQAVQFDAVIVDEAQNIKNVDTKQAQAIRRIDARHRIALTGTPMENRLEELWALMDFLNPGFLGSMSWFRRALADKAERDPNGEEARKLQLLLRPVLLRRRKSDPDIQTELPDKWEVDERTLLTSEQAAIYQAIVNQLFTEINPPSQDAMSRRGQILATLVRLKQVCDHPSLFAGGTPSSKRSGKLRQLIDLLQTVIDEGDSALVFTQFRDMGEILCDTIESELSHRPNFLHGGLSASVRGQMVDDFQSGKDTCPILVLSLRAGGVGLNLTRANHVFHFDRWWNPAVEDQATDRAYRLGQTKDVQVHKMICTGTLEERIDDLITSKRQLTQAIVGGSNEWVTELDNDALYELFRLSDESVWEEDEA